MRKWLALIIICALPLGGAAVISWYLYDSETKQIEAGFQRDISQRAYQLEKELGKQRATMRYWRKFYETSQDAIQPEQFRSIAKDVLINYPSVQFIAWAPMVSKAQRPAFEQQFKRLNPQFSIFTLRPEMNTSKLDEKSIKSRVVDQAFDPRFFFQPSGDQSQYFPIAVLEPMERVGFLTGLDVGSVNPIKVSTQVGSIRDSGDVVALPVLPSPFSPHHEPVLVALTPVYLGDANSVVARRNTLQGFIATLFSVEGLVRTACLSDQPKDIGFQLIDMTEDAAAGIKVLYRYGEPIQHRMSYERPLTDVMGRRWMVVASPSDAYIASRRSVMPYLSLAGGVIFTALFLLYANLTQRQTSLVRALVDERTRELQHANEKLEYLSRIDTLTEIANRRHFNEVFQREWRRSIRETTPLAVLLIDIDFFKRFNDEYGHLRGDECLRAVAQTLASAFKRPCDLVARYGGEEFAVVLPNSGGEVAKVAERCRAAVEELNITHANSDVADHVTVSIGICSIVPSDSMTPENLLDCADKGLYIAKEQGRNRVIYHSCHTCQIHPIAFDVVGEKQMPSVNSREKES